MRLPAAPTGPTLRFDYGRTQQPANPLVKFMYFVPLVSPDAVAVWTNAGNSQLARVVSLVCRTNGTALRANCDFEFTGAGVLRDVFDHEALIRRQENDLKAGKRLEHQLISINVTGAGWGSVEIEGTLTNGAPAVTLVRMHFNGRGQSSPVSINLADIGDVDGRIQPENEIVARVNELIFRRQSDRPEMVVVLASIKSKDAGDGLWQNPIGGLKGMAANLFIPPLKVTADGHQAMMDFGLALALGKPAFTFPFATRLENGP